MNAATGPVIMQKVLTRAQVDGYLDGQEYRVAGYVHRLCDVVRLNTPWRLVAGLGLDHSGSPFQPDAPEIHVLRWPVVAAALYRVPFGGRDMQSMAAMPGGWVVDGAPFTGTGFAANAEQSIPEFKVESVPLPHGAELYRLTGAGAGLRAVFDADVCRWQPVVEGDPDTWWLLHGTAGTAAPIPATGALEQAPRTLDRDAPH